MRVSIGTRPGKLSIATPHVCMAALARRQDLCDQVAGCSQATTAHHARVITHSRATHGYEPVSA